MGEILLSTDGFIPSMQSNEIALKQRRRADRARTPTRPARAQAARYKNGEISGRGVFCFRDFKRRTGHIGRAEFAAQGWKTLEVCDYLDYVGLE